MKTVSLIKGLHVTATEKKHILNLVSQGVKLGSVYGTKRKSYELISVDGSLYEFKITDHCLDDYGRPIDRPSMITVKIKTRNKSQKNIEFDF